MKKIMFFVLTIGLTKNLEAGSPQWQCQNKPGSQTEIKSALAHAITTSENQQSQFQSHLKTLRDQLIATEKEKKSLLNDPTFSTDSRKMALEKLDLKRIATESELFNTLNDNKNKQWKNSSEFVTLIQTSIFWGNYVNNNYPYCELLFAYQQQDPKVFQTELQRLSPKADSINTAIPETDLTNPESPETQFRVLTNMITANDPQ